MPVSEAAKKLDKASKKEGFVIPDMGGLYEKKVRYARDIEIHTKEDVFPYKLFKEKSPHQTDKEFQYVKNNYRAVTVPVMDEFFGITNRILNRSNFSVHYKSAPARDRDAPPKDYFEENYPIYGSLVGHFNVLKKDLLTDPNGVLAVKLHDPPTREVDGETVIDQSERLDPMLTFYSSYEVIEVNKFYLIALSNEKSWIKTGGNDKKEGYVFDYYDSEIIGKYFQVDEKAEWTFEFVETYRHELGYVPFRSVGFNPKFTPEGTFYESPIHAAVEPLNIVAVDNSRLDIAKNKCAYPIKYAFEDPCDNDQCDGGYVWRDGEKAACPDCKGTGFKSDSELTTYRLRTPGGLDEDKSAPVPPVGFAAPDTAILDFLRKEIDANIELAKSQLRINISNENVRGSDTALGKQIDREEMFSFLKGISDHIFDIMKWAYKSIGEVRYQEFDPPMIVEPDEFSIRSSADITEEIAKAKERGLPAIFQHKLLEEDLEKRFNNDKENKEIFRTFISVDRLANSNDKEIQTMFAQRRAALWETILHDSFFTLLEQAQEDDPNFLEKPMSERRNTLITLAKAKEQEINPTVTPEENAPIG